MVGLDGDIVAGTVGRLDSFGGTPPVASFTATPPCSLTPLPVQFDASATTDDGPASQLTFEWDLDGDGAYDDATGVTASRTYMASTNVTVGLRVTDGASATGTATVVIQPGTGPRPGPSSTRSSGLRGPRATPSRSTGP